VSKSTKLPGSDAADEARARALRTLDSARRVRERAEASELAAVAQAREAGVAWGRIGELYGLTKQGAQQRFKPRRTE